MTGRVKSQWMYGWLILVLVVIGTVLSQAEDVTVHEDVVERYEQILERAPVEGPSFDKLLQLYQEGDGLEKLDERWAPWSAQPGVKGATYSLLRGLLADRMGKTDAARKLLQAATQGEPDDFHTWLALGDFEVRQGRWADAIAALQKGLETKVAGDDRLALYRKLGQAQQRNLDVPAALATWQKMVAEFPKDAFALEEAGSAELDAEQYDEAKKTFQKLVDLSEPNSMARVQALMHLAEADDRQGKTEAAVHDYEAILPLTAESSWLNRELRAQIEQVYRREDDLAGLVAYYQKWTQDNPKDVEALLLLAGTLNELGKKPEALDVLRKVVALAPDRHEVRESFAEALVEAKQYDEAITVLTALTADDPTEPRYWETMGDALWFKTQPATPESKKTVLEAWGHIAPAESKDVAAMLQVADLCRDHGLNNEALAGYQRALAVSPDASDIREKAVKLLVDLNRQPEAWKLLDQMTDGPLGTAANYLKLAALDRQFDRKDAMTQAIQQGLALEPGNYDLLSMEWSELAEAQKWSDCAALFDKLMAAAPNAYFVDQLEARQIQALTSAGMLDDAEKKLHVKLGAEPGLMESELRLLLRMLIQKSDPDVAKALDEAHRRFPQSVSLIQIEIDYDRHAGNNDAAVAALQKLIETVPQQKSDWLETIVRVRRDQGNLDEALKTAQQIIDASPASAEGYLTYADIALAADKPDDAVEKLQAAIKLSDKPNEVRQRLARYYLEAGQAAKARVLYDEAFAAADNPQDRLTIVRAMTAAYFQDGHIEELINRFKKEQNSEEGGWRYGLYLSVIDEQMEDYGAARKELAKSLAVRPKDTSLLHSLIGLADKESDRAELLRYREMLAETDPTATNEIALANEYAIQEKPEEAWRVVQKNLGEVVKDPMAWKDVLNQITDPAYAAKVKSVLEEAIRAKGDSFEGKFALVQFQMQQGDLDGAKATLWDILAQPLPPAPTTTAVKPTKSTAGMPATYAIYQTPMMRRVQQSYLALNEAQQLMTSGQKRNQAQQQMSRVRMYNRMGVSTILDPAAMKDHSLIYLSVIAVQQKQAEEFLKELEGKIDSWHWSIDEKLMAYTLIQAREPLLQAIEDEARSSTPDQDLDEFSYMMSEQFISLPVDDPMRKRAEAAQPVLASRLSDNPQFKSFNLMDQINRLSADTSAEGVAKKNAAVSDYLKTVDRKDPQELFQAIGLAAQAGNWEETKKLADNLAAVDPAKMNVTMQQQIDYLPESILQQAATTKETMPKEVVPVVLELLKLTYPSTPPQPTLPGGQNVGPGGIVISGLVGSQFYNPDTFPPANRYFPVDRVDMFEPMYQLLKAREMLPAVYAALDQQRKESTDWRKTYPELITIYFQWWDGKRDEAIAAVQKLLEGDPSDDWRMLLASMLSLEQKNNEAIPVLESVTARYGPDYIRAQKQLLHVARQAKNNDVGQKAALRVLALHLPQQEQLQILDDVRNVGLKDKADEIVAKQNQGRGNPRAAVQANNQLVQTLNNAMNDKVGTRAIEIARGVLNRDPLAPAPYGNENYLRSQALEALKKFGELDAYTRGVENQLAADPDSVRLNWLMAEAFSAAPDSMEQTRGLRPGGHWLKLERKGKSLSAYSSRDGTTWKLQGESGTDLPSKVYVGTWVYSHATGTPMEVTFDHITLTGSFTAAQVAASAATPPADATTDATAPSQPALAPWAQIDIGKVTTPGNAVRGADGSSLIVTGPVGNEMPASKYDSCHYVYQMLDGDGTMVMRVSDIEQQPDDVVCGLVMLEALTVDSRDFGVSLSKRDGFYFTTHDKGSSSSSVSEEFSLKSWLKLARKGDLFTASYSDDGQTWDQVYSGKVLLGPDALAGFYVRNPDRGGEVKWSNVKVNGADVTPPADGTLPPGWQVFEIGPWTTPGKVDWTATGVDVHAPSSADAYDSRGAPFGGYLLLPISGDGEIVAKLSGDSPNGTHYLTTGLCFRDDTSNDAPGVYFLQSERGASFISKMDPQAQSVQYFKRVAELAPKNTALLVTVAEQLRRANKPDAAADLYASILKADFATGMAQSSNAEQVFEDSGRVPEFVKIIQDWTPPPLNPMFGGGQDMYFVLVQAANQLKQGGHRPESEQVLRKALTVDTYQSKQDGVSALAQLLMDDGRRDEAAAEIEKWIQSKAAPAATQPVLGFTVQQVQAQNNWFQMLGWTSNGVIMSPIVHFLQLADALGLSSKLRQELKARADKVAANSGGQVDPNRMAEILLAIISRDPGYRGELEAVIKDHPVATTGVGVNTNGYLILSQELEKWPQERPMALRIARQVYDGLATTSNNGFGQNLVVVQLLKLARDTGDHQMVQEILRKRAETMRQQRAANPNQVPLDQALMVIRQMVQEGMLQDAANFLADSRSDPQLVNGNPYLKQKTEEVENELAFAKGEKGPVGLVYGLSSKTGKDNGGTTLFWQINAGAKDQSDSAYFSRTPWDEGTGSRATKYKLVIKGGADEQHLVQIAAWDNVATRGSRALKLPPGTQAIQASLIDAAVAAKAQKDEPQPVPTATGQVLLLGGPENLLKNPDFQVTKAPSGIMSVAGWHGVLPSAVSQEPGGPLSSAGYQTVDATNGNYNSGSEIFSDQIAVQPNTNYVVGGWMRLAGSLGFRYLDASGKVLNPPNQSVESGNGMEWQWRVWCLQGDPHAPVGGEVLPPNVAFVQLVIRPTQDCDFAGLSLRAWPAPAAK